MTLRNYLERNNLWSHPGLSTHLWPAHHWPPHEGRVYILQQGSPEPLCQGQDRGYYLPSSLVTHCSQLWWWDFQARARRFYLAQGSPHFPQKEFIYWYWIQECQHRDYVANNPLDELWNFLQLGTKPRGWSLVPPQLPWPSQASPMKNSRDPGGSGEYPGMPSGSLLGTLENS